MSVDFPARNDRRPVDANFDATGVDSLVRIVFMVRKSSSSMMAGLSRRIRKPSGNFRRPISRLFARKAFDRSKSPARL